MLVSSGSTLVGTAAGGPAGGALGGAVGGALPEYLATYQEELLSRVDGEPTEEKLIAILRDPEFQAEVDRKAATRAGTIAGVDGLTSAVSAGIANKLLKIGKQATIGRRVAGGLAAAGVENSLGMVGGSTGEFLAQLFSGQEIDLKAIEAEGLAELIGLPGAVGGVGLKAMFGGRRGEVLNWEGNEQNGRSVEDAQGIREADSSERYIPENSLPIGNRKPTQEEVADWLAEQGFFQTMPNGRWYHRELNITLENSDLAHLMMTPDGIVFGDPPITGDTNPQDLDSESSLSDSQWEEPSLPEAKVFPDSSETPSNQLEAPKPDEQQPTPGNERSPQGGQDHPRQLRPGDWGVERSNFDARGSARVGSETIREVHGRLSAEKHGSPGREWREIQAPSEIAAVAAGRKPVFHEQIGPSAQAFAEALDGVFPGLVVEAFDGHLIVVDLEQAAIIAGTEPADMEGTMGKVREAAMSDLIGEYLGYGAGHWQEADAIVDIVDENGELVAGFHTRSEVAEEFAQERMRDYAEGTGQPMEFTIRAKAPGRSSGSEPENKSGDSVEEEGELKKVSKISSDLPREDGRSSVRRGKMTPSRSVPKIGESGPVERQFNEAITEDGITYLSEGDIADIIEDFRQVFPGISYQYRIGQKTKFDSKNRRIVFGRKRMSVTAVADELQHAIDLLEGVPGDETEIYRKLVEKTGLDPKSEATVIRINQWWHRRVYTRALQNIDKGTPGLELLNAWKEEIYKNGYRIASRGKLSLEELLKIEFEDYL